MDVHWCVGTPGGQKRRSGILELELYAMNCSMLVLELNLNVLQEQQVLLTNESSLKSPLIIF